MSQATGRGRAGGLLALQRATPCRWQERHGTGLQRITLRWPTRGSAAPTSSHPAALVAGRHGLPCRPNRRLLEHDAGVDGGIVATFGRCLAACGSRRAAPASGDIAAGNRDGDRHRRCLKAGELAMVSHWGASLAGLTRLNGLSKPRGGSPATPMAGPCCLSSPVLCSKRTNDATPVTAPGGECHRLGCGA